MPVGRPEDYLLGNGNPVPPQRISQVDSQRGQGIPVAGAGAGSTPLDLLGQGTAPIPPTPPVVPSAPPSLDPADPALQPGPGEGGTPDGGVVPPIQEEVPVNPEVAGMIAAVQAGDPEATEMMTQLLDQVLATA